MYKIGSVMTSLLLAVSLAGAPAQAVGADGPAPGAPKQWDGLVLKPSSRVDAVYVEPGADFGVYDSIILDDAEVAFSKDWDPNRGERGIDRVSAKDIQEIRERVAALLREVFTKELTEGGYQLVEEPGHNTLLVRPAIVDLYINAVDGSKPGRMYTYTAEAGRMTLVLELRDSATGDILARAIDASRARETGMFTMSSRNKNAAEARRAFTTWADLLRQALDEARDK